MVRQLVSADINTFKFVPINKQYFTIDNSFLHHCSRTGSIFYPISHPSLQVLLELGNMNALLEGLRRITNIKEETTTPLTKFEPPPVPAHQSNRHHQNSSVIAQGLADINSGARDVYIASRVVGGGFANGLLGRMEKYDFGAIKAVATGGLSVVLNDAPDPTHHWCVVVGDYLHQLQATDLYPGGWNYYTNEVFDMHGGWTKYKLGVTNFNDAAVVNAGKFLIQQIVNRSVIPWIPSLTSEIA
jgi:hypothetical protein